MNIRKTAGQVAVILLAGVIGGVVAGVTGGVIVSHRPRPQSCP